MAFKYDFDTVVDRVHAPWQWSSKWADSASNRKRYGFPDGIPEDALMFSTADMDFLCAPCITDALKKTAEHGIFGYTYVPDEFYNAICHWYKTRFDWEIDPKCIIPYSNGTHKAVREAVEWFTEPDDGVILLMPSYSYHGDIEPIGRRQVPVDLIDDGNGYYTIDFDAFEKACQDPKTTAFVNIQPHNPTGRCWTEEEIKKMGEICEKNGVLIISDEVHIDLGRDGRVCLPFMKVLGPKNVVTTGAINKTFNLAGMATSYMIIENPELKQKFHGGGDKLDPFCIAATIACYTEGAEWVDELNKYVDDLMDYALDRIAKDMPHCKCIRPEGTYCIYMDMSGYGLTSDEVKQKFADCHMLLKLGEQFDQKQGNLLARMTLTSAKSEVVKAFDRMVNVFEKGLPYDAE